MQFYHSILISTSVMGRKSKNTSLELRKLIISYFQEGMSYRDISTLVKRSYSTVQYIIKRFKDEGRILDKVKSGPKFVLNTYDERWIIRQIKKDPKISAPKLAVLLQTQTGKTVSPETVRRVLRRHNFHGRVARTKPYVNKRNRQRRVSFAREYLIKEVDFWKDVIFCDESKFNLFGSDGKKMVWRKPNEEMLNRNILPTVKHGGGSVMVWGCMSAQGVGNLVFIDSTMNHHMYLNILKQNLKSSAENMGILNSFKFYQDNDPKHKAHNVRLWLLYNCPKVLDTPAQSPDLNVIEHLWHELELRVRKHAITNINELKDKLTAEWANISQDLCKKLVSSVPKRLREVIKCKGYPTKY